MNESKIELTRRLQDAGLWDEASQFRDEVRQRLRAEGAPRAEAHEQAWEAMAEQYPPTGEKTQVECPDRPPGPTEIPEWWGEIPDGAPLEEETRWVYEQYFHVVGGPSSSGGNVTQLERASRPAPSHGALNLMAYAARNHKAFMENFVLKLMRGTEQEEEKLAYQKRLESDIQGVLDRIEAEMPPVQMHIPAEESEAQKTEC